METFGSHEEGVFYQKVKKSETMGDLIHAVDHSTPMSARSVYNQDDVVRILREMGGYNLVGNYARSMEIADQLPNEYGIYDQAVKITEEHQRDNPDPVITVDREPN
jgi:hypothetical protein